MIRAVANAHFQNMKIKPTSKFQGAIKPSVEKKHTEYYDKEEINKQHSSNT